MTAPPGPARERSGSGVTRLVRDMAARYGVAPLLVLVALVLVIAFVLAIVLLGRIQGDRSTSRPIDTPSQSNPPGSGPAQSGAAPRWLLTSSGVDWFTVELSGAGVTGPVTVLEDPTGRGAYAWEGDTLTIEFTRTHTVAEGVTFEDPWSFTCTGAPDDTEMECTATRQDWEYRPGEGLEMKGDMTAPVTATRQ